MCHLQHSQESWTKHIGAVDSPHIFMRWRTLLAARHTIRLPSRRRRLLPPTTFHHRSLSLQTLRTTLKDLLWKCLLPSDGTIKRVLDQGVMAQPAAPASQIPLLQQLVGLIPPQDDAKELQDVVFVCIDCEAFEFDAKKVTEVGVSILDTSKIDMVSGMANRRFDQS